MSATEPDTTAGSPPAPHTAGDAEDKSSNTTTADSGKEGGGLWGWRSKLMRWRSGGGGGGRDDGAEAKAGAASSDETAKKSATEGEAKKAGSAEEAAAAAADEAPSITAAPPTAAPATRPMNIWLRRALERQAESAIAEALRDGKPVPAKLLAETTATTVQDKASEASHTDTKVAEEETATPSAANAVATSPETATRISFADLMRQHREGLLEPSAQPPVKATTVVKKAKPVAVAAESPTTTPSIRKRTKHTAPAEAKAEEAAAARSPATDATESGDVHKVVVRKRVKTTAASPLTSASAKRTQETSAAASACATPTQTITVRGKASLEELRALRNRTSVTSANNTPSPVNGRGSGAAGRVDGYNEGALDAVSQLLLRYCLGDPTKTAAAAAATATTTTSDATNTDNTNTSSELAFFNQLMELCEANSLTPESLELLRELFQHVRVQPRPSTAPATATEPSATANTTGATAAAAAEAEKAAAADADAYREASRRREYVQQVIMVLINRLKQLKLNEQQRERQQQEQEEAAAAAAAAATSAPQPVIGHATPSIRVGGVPLTPLPVSAAAPPPSTTAPPLRPLSYEDQMRRLAEWRAMAELASGNSMEDEAAAAAAFASTMAANGYPNPYAHLTVFAQHQPVAPPVGWLSATTSRSSSGSAGARLGHGAAAGSHPSHTHNSVAARLMPSPFPGAFPIIPPPSSADSGAAAAKEDREMQELFRMIRTQLTQHPHTRSEATPGVATAAAVAAPPAASAVDVSLAERAVLRHVQNDFKQRRAEQQQQQQQQQKDENATSASGAPTASTPPTAPLDAPAAEATLHCTTFSPQGTRDDTTKTDGSSATATPPRRGGALNLDAKPFMPGQPSAAAAAAVTAASSSTPTKTHFNPQTAPFVPRGMASGAAGTGDSATPPRSTIRYEAKPFVPGAANTSSGGQRGSAPAGAAPTSQMNATAKAFVPGRPQPQPQQRQQQQSPFMAAGPGSSGFDGQGNADPASDPWASYEMFARWRDMMESYYQGMFAAQQMGATASSSNLATPPRPA